MVSAEPIEIFDANGEWRRRPEHVAALVRRADYPCLRKPGLLVTQSLGAWVLLSDGSVLPLRQGRSALDGRAELVGVFARQAFSIALGGTTEARFEVDGAHLPLLERAWLVTPPTVLTLETVRRRAEAELAGDLQAMTWSGEAPNPIRQARLVEWFTSHGLRLVMMSRMATAKRFGPQDAQHACIVALNRDVISVCQVGEAGCFIGRGRSAAYLQRHLEDLRLAHPRCSVLALPPADELPGLCAVGRVIPGGPTGFQFLSGWPNLAVKERVFVQGRSVRMNQGTPLNGFERLSLEHTPWVQVVFVPPMAPALQPPTPAQLGFLEFCGLWASAALGWARLGHLENALRDLEIALEAKLGPEQKANLLLAAAHLARRLAQADPGRSAAARQYQALAADVLGTPAVEVEFWPRQAVVGQEVQVTIQARNLSTAAPALRPILSWKCDGVGMTAAFDLPDLPSGERSAQKVIRLTPRVPGRFSVEKGFEQAGQAGLRVLAIEPDTFLVVPRPVRVSGDAGAVIVETERSDQLPEFDLGGDVGLLKIRIIGEPKEG